MSFEKLWEQYGDKKTKMQYPFDGSGHNRLFDGKEHEILPRELKPLKLNGIDFEVMRYYDITMGVDAITLLTKIGDALVKVPLDDYSILMDYLNENNVLTNEDSDFYLPNIKLGQTMNTEELIYPNTSRVADQSSNPPFPPRTQTNSGGNPPLGPSGFNWLNPPSGPSSTAIAGGSVPPDSPSEDNYTYANNDSEIPIHRFIEYVPLKDDGTTKNVRGGYFSSLYSYIEQDSKGIVYVYGKSPCFKEKDNLIQENIANKKDNESTYKFRLYVSSGEKGRVYSVRDDGSVKADEVFLIPGIHEYEVKYAKCKSSEEYSASKHAKTIEINSYNSSINTAYVDSTTVFRKGMLGDLSADFYNADGNKIGNSINQHRQRR